MALVLNPAVFSSATDVMKAYSAPVSYLDEGSFVSWFHLWSGRLLTAESRLKNVNPEIIRNVLYHAFRVFAMCTKHPGFHEEREWRVYNSTTHEGGSPWLELATEVVRGLPQPIVKLGLFDDEAAGVTGIAAKSLINRVIIGPCEYPLQVRTAMWGALVQAGVENIESKIWMSLIPLRQR